MRSIDILLRPCLPPQRSFPSGILSAITLVNAPSPRMALVRYGTTAGRLRTTRTGWQSHSREQRCDPRRPWVGGASLPGPIGIGSNRNCCARKFGSSHASGPRRVWRADDIGVKGHDLAIPHPVAPSWRSASQG